ncbi:MAG: hypothetical protein SGILL_002865, partial [Bacillariaceae sp.]
MKIARSPSLFVAFLAGCHAASNVASGQSGKSLEARELQTDDTCELISSVNCIQTGSSNNLRCEDIVPPQKQCLCPNGVDELYFTYDGVNGAYIVCEYDDGASSTLYGPLDKGEMLKIMPSTPDTITCNLADAGGTPLPGAPITIDPSCDGEKELNLEQSFENILTFVGYVCSDGAVNKCLVDVTYKMRVCNIEEGTEVLESARLEIGIGPVNSDPTEILEVVEDWEPDAAFPYNLGSKCLRLEYASVANFCGQGVRYNADLFVTAETPTTGLPCKSYSKYCYNNDPTTFSPTTSPSNESPSDGTTFGPASGPTPEPTVCIEYDVDFNGFSNGQYIFDELSDECLSVTAIADNGGYTPLVPNGPDNNAGGAPRVFDTGVSDNCDSDLMTPSPKFFNGPQGPYGKNNFGDNGDATCEDCCGGGPELATYNSGTKSCDVQPGTVNPYKNDVPLYNVLVIQESQKDCPDDNAGGGDLVFEFCAPILFQEITLLDVDGPESADVTFYFTESSGKQPKEVDAPVAGDNGVWKGLFSEEDVVKVVVSFSGSG